MTFHPVPENDFLQFVDIYYSRIHELIPKLEVATGKWDYIDLLPGMSDFDTRFIFADPMVPEDWIQASTAVGRVHYELFLERPDWARKLEHTPGINITWSEFTNPNYYYPEFLQWTGYCGKLDRFAHEQYQLEQKGWSHEDELYHINRFFTYFGPYNRSIDPAINLGPFENKYPLHSRMMHYYLPPLQSALSILRNQTVRGKLETLMLALEMVPELQTTRQILHAVEHHYELPLLYVEPFLSRLEEDLEQDLILLYSLLTDKISCIDREIFADPNRVRAVLRNMSVNVTSSIFSSLRFSRLLKGRLYFYTEVDERFDSIWLIRNELQRICNLFLVDPLRLFYQKHCPGSSEQDVMRIIDMLSGDIFDQEEAAVLKRYYHITKDMPHEGEEIKKARDVMEVFDDFYLIISKLIN